MAVALSGWTSADAAAHAATEPAHDADAMDGLEKFTLVVNMAAQGLYVARWYIGDEVIGKTLGLGFLLWATTIVGLLAGISLDTTAVVTTMGRRRGRYHWIWSNLTIFSAAAFSGLIALQVHGGGIVPAAWLHVANVVAVVCLIQHLSQPRQVAAGVRQELADARQALTDSEQVAADLRQELAAARQALAAAEQGVVTTAQIEATARQAIDSKQREIDRLVEQVTELRQIATAPVDPGDINTAWLVAALKHSGKTWAELEQGTGANVSRLRRLAASVEGM